MDVNMISWFEIPVTNMDRAKEFYEAVFQVNISVHDLGGVVMGWFPPAENNSAPGISGSLVKHEEYIPSSTDGVLVYFNSQSGDIDHELSRVEKAGGDIVRPKTLISDDIGYMAVIKDTEGNRIALYNK